MSSALDLRLGARINQACMRSRLHSWQSHALQQVEALQQLHIHALSVQAQAHHVLPCISAKLLLWSPFADVVSCHYAAGGSTTATTSGDPVLALSLSSSVDGGADSAAAPSLVPVQLMQHQPATDVLGAPSTSSSEQASSRQLKDAPLLQVNRAQLSRSSSQIVSSPTVIQPGAKPVHAWSTDAMSYPSAAVAAATAATPEGLPLFGDAVLALPGSHFSAHSLSTVAALNPQESGTPDLLAAVNAVAGRLSLRHTASQSSHAGLPSISEASVAAHGDMPAALAQQQGGAATGVNGSPQGLMFSSAASGYRRTISNLRTGGSVTASMAADMPRVASLTRQTSQGIQLPAYQLPGMVCTARYVQSGSFATDVVAATHHSCIPKSRMGMGCWCRSQLAATPFQCCANVAYFMPAEQRALLMSSPCLWLLVILCVCA